MTGEAVFIHSKVYLVQLFYEFTSSLIEEIYIYPLQYGIDGTIGRLIELCYFVSAHEPPIPLHVFLKVGGVVSKRAFKLESFKETFVARNASETSLEELEFYDLVSSVGHVFESMTRFV